MSEEGTNTPQNKSKPSTAMRKYKQFETYVEHKFHSYPPDKEVRDWYKFKKGINKEEVDKLENKISPLEKDDYHTEEAYKKSKEEWRRRDEYTIIKNNNILDDSLVLENPQTTTVELKFYHPVIRDRWKNDKNLMKKLNKDSNAAKDYMELGLIWENGFTELPPLKKKKKAQWYMFGPLEIVPDENAEKAFMKLLPRLKKMQVNNNLWQLKNEMFFDDENNNLLPIEEVHKVLIKDIENKINIKLDNLEKRLIRLELNNWYYNTIYYIFEKDYEILTTKIGRKSFNDEEVEMFNDVNAAKKQFSKIKGNRWWSTGMDGRRANNIRGFANENRWKELIDRLVQETTVQQSAGRKKRRKTKRKKRNRKKSTRRRRRRKTKRKRRRSKRRRRK